MKAENIKKKVWALALVFAMLMAMMAPALAAGSFCGLPGCSCTDCSYTYRYISQGSTGHAQVGKCSKCNVSSEDDYWETSHYFSGGNTCIQCGYTKPCDHTSTSKSWSGCTYYNVCAACGIEISGPYISHSSTVKEWDGCTYYNVCRSCGATISGPYTSHSWSSYSYAYTNSSTHTGTRYCTDCGTSSSTSGSHSTTNRYATYSDTQHRVEAYCATCNSVVSTSTGSHSYVYGSWTKLDNTRESRSVACSLCAYTGIEYQEHADGNGDGLCDSCNAAMNVIVTFRHYGSVSDTVTVRYGGTVTVPGDPVRAGYDFMGWVDEDGRAYNFTAPVYEDTTATATWTARGDTAYTVNHYQQNVEGDGYTLADTDHLTGTTDATGIANERAYPGFRLNGESSTMEGKVSGDGALVLDVYYDRVPLTVSIVLEGKEETLTLRYGETLPVPESPTRLGYDFAYWADGEGNEFDFSVPVTGPVTLAAVWTPRNDTPYTVEHYQQTLTGDYVLADAEELTGTTDTTAAAVAKTYTGFHEDIDCAGRVASGNIEADGSLVLALYYDRNGDTPYTVIHYWQTVDKEGYEQGEAEKLLGVTGFTVTASFKSFTGFHSSEEHPGNQTSGVVAGDGSLVLSLYYDRDTVTVSVDLGRDDPLTQEIPYGGTIPKPDDPTKPGYIFTGWKDENGNLYDFNTPITGDLVLTSSWQVQAPPQEWEKPDLSSTEPSWPWLADLGDLRLTRAQAVYILSVYLNAEPDDMKLTTAFDDVDEETEYGVFISWANGAGIVAGYGNRLFGPADGLTREQLALMLYRLYGDESRADLTAYADGDRVSWWAYEAVRWAASKDFLPVEEDKLRPWDGVTGKEMAALLEKIKQCASS